MCHGSSHHFHVLGFLGKRLKSILADHHAHERDVIVFHAGLLQPLEGGQNGLRVPDLLRQPNPARQSTNRSPFVLQAPNRELYP